MEATLIRKGERLVILPQWRDSGDEGLEYVAVDDEEKGRVTISPVKLEGWHLPFMPREVVESSMVQRL